MKLTTMSKFVSSCLLVLTMLFPMNSQGQDKGTVDLGEYVEELNSQCPVIKESWGIGSITMVGDNYALVDVLLPSNLSMFLSSLTSSNRENVRQLWIKQLKQFGEPWSRLVNTMVQTDRRIIVNLRPEGSDETALVTLYPSDFKNSKP